MTALEKPPVTRHPAPPLAALCVARLADALDPATALFDRQLRDRQWAPTLGTEEVTSTAICLVGLDRAGIDPGRLALDPARTLASLRQAAARHAYPGALGLVLWANAVHGGPPLPAVTAELGMPLDPPAPFARRLTTMEVAWLVTGLLHEAQRAPGGPAEAALAAARDELLGRFGARSWLFSHAGSAAPLADRLRRNVANFADQIYSVQALALLARARRDGEALQAATACARRLVQLQGGRGQWWWHYDPRRGRVARDYPVYSVHQHGMAPMALLAVTAAGGPDFSAVIRKSRGWIADNELGIDLADTEAGTIWRSVERRQGRAGRLAGHGRAILGWTPEPRELAAEALTVNFETRPYEWAWWLYADALESCAPSPEHIL